MEIEALWDELLSEDADKVRRAWRSLSVEERASVHVHLHKMADPQEGYAEVQQASARAALAVIADSSS